MTQNQTPVTTTEHKIGKVTYLVCSSASERATDTLDKKIKKLIRKDMELNPANARKSVSYTHLDVYKRQVPYAVIAPFVGIVFVVVYEVYGAENDMIVDLSLIHILLVGKFPKPSFCGGLHPLKIFKKLWQKCGCAVVGYAAKKCSL